MLLFPFLLPSSLHWVVKINLRRLLLGFNNVTAGMFTVTFMPFLLAALIFITRLSLSWRAHNRIIMVMAELLGPRGHAKSEFNGSQVHVYKVGGE